MGLTQIVKRFVAQRANQFSINHDDHANTRYMEDQFFEDNKNTNPQLTEIFFIKSQFIFVINCMNKKCDNVISSAFRLDIPKPTILNLINLIISH